MRIYDKKIFKEGLTGLVAVLGILALVVITDIYDLKRHSAFVFNIVWMSCLNIKTIIISLSEEKSRKYNTDRRLANTARNTVFGKKEPLVHILWLGLMIGSMPATLYSVNLALIMFLGGCGVLVWYIYVIDDKTKELKNDVEFIIEE